MTSNRDSAGLRRKLLLLCVSALMCLVCVEIGLRALTAYYNRTAFESVFSNDVLPPEFREGELNLAALIRPVENPRRIYELRPGLSGSYHGGDLTTNELGFRGRPYPVEKPEGVVRIVGIGDSFMFGLGVDDEATYLTQAEDLLEAGSDAQKWQVVNTGVPGYNGVMEVEALRDVGLAFSPDVVVMGFAGNDLDLPNFIRSTPSPYAGRSFLLDWLLREWRDEWGHPLIEVLNRGRLTNAPKAEGSPRFEHAPERVPPEYRALVGWAAYAGALAELQELSEREGFEVVLLSLSVHEGPLLARASELAAELGFNVVHVGPRLRTYMKEHGIERHRGSVLTVSATDNHPSAIAHRLAAEELTSHLLRSGRDGDDRVD